MTSPDEPPELDKLIICPHCDVVHHLDRLPSGGEHAFCTRCKAVLIAPRRKAGMQIIMLSWAVVILVIAAIWFPFLSIDAAGLGNAVSLLDAARAFEGGIYAPLTYATAALIVFIPFLRALLAIYVLTPLVFDHPPAPGAIAAFRLVEALRPWSMAEIFVLGCAVALVKVGDLADIIFGPAFWLFAILAALLLAKDSIMCRWSVWQALEAKS